MTIERSNNVIAIKIIDLQILNSIFIIQHWKCPNIHLNQPDSIS